MYIKTFLPKQLKEKGFTLVMAMMFMLVFSAIATALLMRQSHQWSELTALGKRSQLQQCAELAYEAVMASLVGQNIRNRLNIVVPGMLIYSGHYTGGSISTPVPSEEFPLLNESVAGGGTVSGAGLAGMTCYKGFPCKGGGATGVPLGPVVSCLMLDSSGNVQNFVEIEIALTYKTVF